MFLSFFSNDLCMTKAYFSSRYEWIIAIAVVRKAISEDEINEDGFFFYVSRF